MFTPELASLDLRECSDLAPGTLVAPLPILREIRCALGFTDLNLIVGDQEVVLVSSDLYSAFNAWEASQEDIEGGHDEDPSMLN